MDVEEDEEDEELVAPFRTLALPAAALKVAVVGFTTAVAAAAAVPSTISLPVTMADSVESTTVPVAVSRSDSSLCNVSSLGGASLSVSLLSSSC